MLECCKRDVSLVTGCRWVEIILFGPDRDRSNLLLRGTLTVYQVALCFKAQELELCFLLHAAFSGVMSELAESNASQMKALEGEKRTCKIQMLQLEVRDRGLGLGMKG